ncbi:MAG: DUF5522 domain-containing protein [Planctomycetota bacterium]
MTGSSPEPADLPAQLLTPHPDRLDPSARDYAEICERHEAAVRAGLPMYEDPSTGLWVMTASSLWQRACCENICRHCPHVARPSGG